jgi:hypothetical protein
MGRYSFYPDFCGNRDGSCPHRTDKKARRQRVLRRLFELRFFLRRAQREIIDRSVMQRIFVCAFLFKSHLRDFAGIWVSVR